MPQDFAWISIEVGIEVSEVFSNGRMCSLSNLQELERSWSWEEKCTHACMYTRRHTHTHTPTQAV